MSENWTVTSSQRRRIEAAVIKLLLPLAAFTLHDHKTNDFIRRELKITGILDKIDEYRLNWHLHLQTMSQNLIPLKSYHYRPQGKRTIGRPKKRWPKTVVTLETERIKLIQSLMFMMMMMMIKEKAGMSSALVPDNFVFKIFVTFF